MSFSMPRAPRKERPALALHDRALDDIRFIRETMERSTSFTAVSGRGGILMGVVALLAAVGAGRTTSVASWVAVWLGAAALSLGVALWAMSAKARSAGTTLLAGAGTKFAWNVSPPLLVGGLLTVAFLRDGLTHLLPGTWLVMSGTGVVTGGAFSVRAVPLMGLLFMILGAAALYAPASWGDGFMALGFGGLHLVFGGIIWRKYGG
jgi:hypothetical protein